MIKSLYM